jgi:hypothetical protein
MIDTNEEITPPENFICPISFDLMTDPLISIYGHRYQREAILGWLGQGNSTCPLTRKPLTLRMLVKDCRLQLVINGWMRQNGLAVQYNTEREDRERVVGLGCILTPSKPELQTFLSTLRQARSESQRRPHRFLHRRQSRTPSASISA